MGGSDGTRVYRDVFALQWIDGRLATTRLPELPSPRAFPAATVAGESVFLAGGQASVGACEGLRTFWRLDLDVPPDERRWDVLPELPGPGRILPVLAVQHDGFRDVVLLAGGCALSGTAEGEVRRRYLTDAWVFIPADDAGDGAWQQVAELPRPAAGAPVVSVGQSHVLILGGDDGEHFDRIEALGDGHPGFRTDVLAYHTFTDTWTTLGSVPVGLVTTPAVWWQGQIVVPGGEDRPGHRDASVLRGRFTTARVRFGLANHGVLIAYLLALVGMGVYFSRREKSTDDFFLGGRRVPWWAAGISIFGTMLSAITFMAFPAKAYAQDWVFVVANLCVLPIVPIVVFFYLPFYRRLNVTTAYEYLEKRFNLAVRLFGSATFVLFQLGRLAIVLFLPSIALAAVTDIPVWICIVVMGVLATLYTVLGGIEAVIWTDVLQVVVLLGGALISLVVIAAGVDGGLGRVISIGQIHDKFRTFDWTWDCTVASVWVVIVGNLCINLFPYTSDQTVVQRYLTTRDERQAARSIWTIAILAVPATFLFFAVGTALFAFYASHPGRLNPSMQTDAVFPWFIARELPVGVAGLVIAGVFAAAMSSLDSSLNSMSTAIVTDFYRRFRAGADEGRCLRLARVLTALLGAVGTATALVMATYDIKSVVDVYSTVIGLFGGGLAGVFALGVFTRRAHGPGALVGAVVSAVTLCGVQMFTGIHFFLYAAVGLGTSLGVGYLASVVVPVRQRDLAGLTVHSLSARQGERGPG
jgi:SSS family transporter